VVANLLAGAIGAGHGFAFQRAVFGAAIAQAVESAAATRDNISGLLYAGYIVDADRLVRELRPRRARRSGKHLLLPLPLPQSPRPAPARPRPSRARRRRREASTVKILEVVRYGCCAALPCFKALPDGTIPLGGSWRMLSPLLYRLPASLSNFLPFNFLFRAITLRKLFRRRICFEIQSSFTSFASLLLVVCRAIRFSPLAAQRRPSATSAYPLTPRHDFDSFSY
jgi:hypothetical protein